ncbi:hypothetical protein [Streptomyces flavidovirens]|uniref:hypothetical protein n=1 Tax=Streptomyces flavidovirens TaxID=67298 RepID=UPI00041BFFD6|nr:hypothetical protein [Streptomyces flavidovirens]
MKVRRAKEGNLYGAPGLYRVVEVCEDVPSAHARQLVEVLSWAVGEIGQAATAAVGGYEPARQHPKPLEVLSNFFDRTVVSPWHLAYPGDRGDGSYDGTLHGSEPSHVSHALERLLLTHLEALDMPLQAPAMAVPRNTQEGTA